MLRNIISIVILAAAVAIFVLYTEPSYDSMQALSAQSAQYDAALSKATQLQELKQTLLSRYNSFDPNALSRLSVMLPDQVNNISLILNLDNLAGQYGMALQNVNISSPDQSSSGSAVNAIGNASQPYDSLTLQFTTQGTYPEFVQFLTALESSLQLVDVNSISISSSGSGSGAGAQPVYTYTMSVQTYWLR